jgi:hypothetical protein
MERILTWLVILCLVIALPIAWWCGRICGGNEMAVMNDIASAGSLVRALRHLRDGDQEEAIDSLETMLDGNIIGMGADLLVGKKPTLAAEKILSRVKEYRTVYPIDWKERQSEMPYVDLESIREAIETILSHVEILDEGEVQQQHEPDGDTRPGHQTESTSQE